MSKVYNVTKKSVYLEVATICAESVEEAKELAKANEDIDWQIVDDEIMTLDIQYFHD